MDNERTEITKIPAWMCGQEEYIPANDRESFLTKSIEIRTAPTVPFKICRMAAAEKKARRTVTVAHMINTNK